MNKNDMLKLDILLLILFLSFSIFTSLPLAAGTFTGSYPDPNARSCSGICGNYNIDEGCQCDAACVTSKDCCNDYYAFCQQGGNGTPVPQLTPTPIPTPTPTPTVKPEQCKFYCNDWICDDRPQKCGTAYQPGTSLDACGECSNGCFDCPAGGGSGGMAGGTGGGGGGSSGGTPSAACGNEICETGEEQTCPQDCPAESIEELNSELTSLASQYKAKTGMQKKQVADEISATIKQRKAEMLEVIEEDTEEFLDNVLPKSTRDSLPSDVKQDVESEIAIQAPIVVVNVDDFENQQSRNEYFLQQAGETLEFHPVGEEPQILSGTIVHVNGYALADNIVASTGSQTFQVVQAASITGTKGDYKLAVFLVDFQDSPQRPITKEQVRDSLFYGNVQKFYKEASYNQLSFSGDVFDWYKLSRNLYVNGVCSQIGFLDDFKQIIQELVTKNNVNLEKYSGIVFVSPTCPSRWGGTLGKMDIEIGGKKYKLSITWVDPYQTLSSSPTLGNDFDFVVAHELGHNLGVMHANSYSFCNVKDGIIPGNCQHVEYGNYYDVMGTGTYSSHFNSYFKNLFNWFDSNSVLTITQSGRYTLKPLEISSGVRGAKILQPNVNNDNPVYYLEYRRGIGFDLKLNEPPLISNQRGLFVNYVSPSGFFQDTPHLLDMDGDLNWLKVTLNKEDGIFEDKQRGISIGPIINADENGITFDVKLSGVYKPILYVGPVDLNFVIQSEDDTYFGYLNIFNEGSQDLIWSISSDSKWMELDDWGGKTNGVLAPNKKAEIRAKVSAKGLKAGEYKGAVKITSNDVNLDIPATLNFNPLPKIKIEPTELSFFSYKDGDNPPKQMLTVTNEDNQAIKWFVSTKTSSTGPSSTIDWLSVKTEVGEEFGTLQPAGKLQLFVYVKTAGLGEGTYDGVIYFNTEKVAPLAKIPVRLDIKIGDPLAKLTANDEHEVTVNVGDTITYSWSSKNALGATSWYSVDGNDCLGDAGTRTWIANTLSGSKTEQLQQCQAGRTYWTTYKVSNAAGKTAEDTVIVHVNQAGGGGSTSEDIFKVGIIEDYPTIPPNYDEEIETARKLAQAKNLDLLMFHENFFDALNGLNILYLSKLNEEEYVITGADNEIFLSRINKLIGIAKDYKTNILLVTLVGSKFAPPKALLINRSGAINYVYSKGSEFELFSLISSSGKPVPTFVQICGGPIAYYKTYAPKNFGAYLYLHPAWGGEETLPQAVMEVSQLGSLSDATFNFLNDPSLGHWNILKKYNLVSKQDVENRIKNRVYPFNWTSDFISLLSGKDLNSNGYVLTADQIQSNGIFSLNGNNKLIKMEYGPDFSYVYAELKLIKDCADGCPANGQKRCNPSNPNYIQTCDYYSSKCLRWNEPGVFCSNGCDNGKCLLGNPTTSLTANGQKEITVNAGDSVVYTWSTANADYATSWYSVDGDDCTGKSVRYGLPWVAKDIGSTTQAAILNCQAGRTYWITYKVFQSSTGKYAEDTVIVHINAVSTPCTNDCNTDQTRCNGNYRQTCGSYDSDSCLEWPESTSGNGNEYCPNGCDVASGKCITTPTPPPVTIYLNAVQGYDPVTGQYSYNDAYAGKYLILWGSFPASGNEVYVNGVKQEVTYQSTNQLNVLLSLSVGERIQALIFVKNAGVNSNTLNFYINPAPGGTTPACTGINADCDPQKDVSVCNENGNLYTCVINQESHCKEWVLTQDCSLNKCIIETHTCGSSSGPLSTILSLFQWVQQLLSGQPSQQTGNPTASLTANGQKEVTVNVGENMICTWSSTNADYATSWYSVDGGDCTGQGTRYGLPWVANTVGSSTSAQVQQCQAGRTYGITYKVIQSSTGKYAEDTITIHVNG